MSLDSGSSKTFPRKVKEGGLKITPKNFEKGATKPGKKGVKQFKNKQQGDKIPKNKFQQANKFNRKRKFPPDSKVRVSTVSFSTVFGDAVPRLSHRQNHRAQGL